MDEEEEDDKVEDGEKRSITFLIIFNAVQFLAGKLPI